MTRILFTLAVVSLSLLIATLLIGLSIGDLYAEPQPDASTLRWATVHRLTGVAAALVVVLVESIVATYFIGTSRWCKEVVETYHFDPAAVRSSARLKRRTFPWALAGMLAVVAMIALGGASDPATGRPTARDWVEWHLVGTVVGILFIGWTYFVAWNNVVANQAIIERLVDEVARVRRQRGIEPDDASLQQSSA